MSLITKIRKQNAVYWQATQQNQFGDWEFLPGIDVKVRWEEKQTNKRDATGQKVVFNSRVFVDRVMPLGSRLLYRVDTEYPIGYQLKDLPGAAKPPDDAREIKMQDDTPQKKPTKPHLLIVYL